MDRLRAQLEQALTALPGVEITVWKDTELVCVVFEGREVAHFHAERILDLRLTPKIIRQEGLGRDVSRRIHPNRSLNSRWIGLEIRDADDIPQVVRLVALACTAG